jgi:hypothetical protein
MNIRSRLGQLEDEKIPDMDFKKLSRVHRAKELKKVNGFLKTFEQNSKQMKDDGSSKDALDIIERIVCYYRKRKVDIEAYLES